jgi:hypothetical protein
MFKLPKEIENKIFFYIEPRPFITQIKDICKTLDIYRKDENMKEYWLNVSYCNFILNKNRQKMILNGCKLKEDKNRTFLFSRINNNMRILMNRINE